MTSYAWALAALLVGTGWHPASSSLQCRVFTAGKTPGFPAGGFALGIAAGPGGTMWFTDAGRIAIGRISARGRIAEFSNGLPYGAKPLAIVAGPDGNMWFTDARGLVIGKVTPDGTITEYAASSTGATAQNLAFDRTGTPWFVATGKSPALAYVTPKGRVATVALPAGLSPDGSLVSDAAGNLWMLARNEQGTVTVLERTPSATYRMIWTRLGPIANPCCPNVAPNSLAVGPDGNPYFTTLYYGSAKYPGKHLIARVRSGRVELAVTAKNPGLPAYPSGIAAGAHGIWLTGGDPFQSNGALWRIGARGVQSVWPAAYNPLALTLDASGHPWFTATFPTVPSQIVEVVAH